MNACTCRQGRDECTCGLMCAIEPIEQDLPLNRWTLLVAVVGVASAALLSHVFR